MELIIEKDYENMSSRTADMIIEIIVKKPDALLCLAAGDTPRLAYSYVAQRTRDKKIDTSRCKFVSLDEWVGIPPENEGSCQYFLRNVVFGPMNIAEKNIHLFNALSTDLTAECRNMDEFIRKNGGIDVIVVGVGRNGHIGFNEPGVPFGLYSHVVELDDTTTSVGQKYFREQTILTKGITLGLQWLIESETAIMIANGIKKAEVMKEAIEGDIHPNMPASVMRRHSQSFTILDNEAASMLTQSAG